MQTVGASREREWLHLAGMRTSWQSCLITSAIVGTGLFSLAACTVGPDSVESPAVEQPDSTAPEKPATPAPVEEPPASAEQMTVELPTDCDALIPANLLAPEMQQYPDKVAGWAITMFGPKTHETVLAGESLLMCGWGLPNSDALAVVAVSIISEPAKNALAASLEGSIYADVSAAYKDQGIDTDLAYTRPPAEALQYIATVLIDGPVVVATAQTTNGEFAGDAMRSIQRLNEG